MCVCVCVVCVQDLCDIEEELETKLGVFHVHVLGLAGLGHGGIGGRGGGGGGGGGGGVGVGGGEREWSGGGGSVAGESFEVQLKLSNQKWRSRCRLVRGQQVWQDEDVSWSCDGHVIGWGCRGHLRHHSIVTRSHDSPPQIIFLGKVNDELFVKVLGIRRIQGNTLVGCVKCQTRQLFSFYPQVSCSKYSAHLW